MRAIQNKHYLSGVKSLLKKLFRFLSHGVWTVDENKLNRTNRYLVKLIRIIILAFQDFSQKNLILQASALTFYTLLSIVPVAAMVFGMAKGFGLEQRMREELFRSFENQPELLEQLLGFVNSLLANTQGGLVAVFGFIVLLWSVLQMLSSVEESFNSIWQITTNRTWVRKFTDYFSILLIAPIFIIVAGSATIIITSFITEFTEEWIRMGFLKELFIFAINLIPYVLNALLFTLIYIIIPNTRVKFKSAVVAGMVAGFTFQLFQWGYIEFQVGVSRMNAIYGSFAFFPLFITFLQLSWMIVLLGAEVSYSLQNIHLHIDERQHFIPTNRQKFILALTILALSCKRFENGKPAYSAQELSERLDVPYKMLKEFCIELCRAGLLSELKSVDNSLETRYQPAVGPDKIDMVYVMSRLDGVSVMPKEIILPDDLKSTEKLVDDFYTNSSKAKYNMPILEIYPQLSEEALNPSTPDS
ncbi:MAG TPA: hypothetical protein DIW47_08330 [Bacteroidetes bacterium]|nr:hypothetical protein [Bacteroidota bacterium]